MSFYLNIISNPQLAVTTQCLVESKKEKVAHFLRLINYICYQKNLISCTFIPLPLLIFHEFLVDNSSCYCMLKIFSILNVSPVDVVSTVDTCAVLVAFLLVLLSLDVLSSYGPNLVLRRHFYIFLKNTFLGRLITKKRGFDHLLWLARLLDFF